MTAIYSCDTCKAATQNPSLHIERTDGFGGGGIPIPPGPGWDLCRNCSVALSGALESLRRERAS